MKKIGKEVEITFDFLLFMKKTKNVSYLLLFSNIIGVHFIENEKELV